MRLGRLFATRQMARCTKIIYFCRKFVRMKVTRSLITLIALVLLTLSCSNDFELEATWKDIPVVYGFLSRQDTAHYIRVEKAFLEPGGNASQIAQIADSLYYDDKVQVQLERVSSGQTYLMQRVDGSKEGYPREDGAFATQPNVLYKIPATAINLRAGETIRLLINRGEDKAPATAETKILDEIIPRETNPLSPVNFGYDRSVSFAWNTDEAAQIFDLRLIIHYLESKPGNSNDFEAKELVWVLADDLLRENQDASRVTYEVEGIELYKFLAANLEPVSDRVRIFQTFDIQITGAGEELVEALRLIRINSGITSSQTIPTYTNLSEGRGIFSSRSMAIRTGLTLNSAAQDSLRDGMFTRDLNFR